MRREWLIGVLLLGAAARLPAAEALDPALLDYLEKFTDEKGAVFDPRDLDDARQAAAENPPKDPPKQESTHHE